jgi:hypothetical protein
VITAVDTNVLLDIFGADPTFGRDSALTLRRCLGEGRLVAGEVVWAETASFFESQEAAVDALTRLGVDFVPANVESALAAAVAWKEYRRRGGGRDRVAADFLVGSHAAATADRLLTRDRGFYRAYFAGLTVLDPSREPTA